MAKAAQSVLVGGQGNDLLSYEFSDGDQTFDFAIADYRSSPAGIFVNLTADTLPTGELGVVLAPFQVRDGFGTANSLRHPYGARQRLRPERFNVDFAVAPGDPSKPGCRRATTR